MKCRITYPSTRYYVERLTILREWSPKRQGIIFTTTEPRSQTQCEVFI